MTESKSPLSDDVVAAAVDNGAGRVDGRPLMTACHNDAGRVDGRPCGDSATEDAPTISKSPCPVESSIKNPGEDGTPLSSLGRHAAVTSKRCFYYFPLLDSPCSFSDLTLLV